MSQNLWIASDHAGYLLKQYLIKNFSPSPWMWRDLGPDRADVSVDYPDYARLLCHEFVSDSNALGILICGSGIGMSIAANRNKDIRAALVFNEAMARLSRQHNDANVLCLGARFLREEEALQILGTWLATSFEGGRHENRVQKINHV